MKSILFSILILIMSLYSIHSFQNQYSEIELINADSLVGLNLNDISTREFFWNVKFRHKDVNVKSDYAKQYINENKVELIGNVVITQNTLNLFSPKINYNGNSNIAYALDSVSIIDLKTNLIAKSGIYYTNTNIADFTGDVKVEDDSVIIYASRIIYERQSRISKAYDRVLMIGKFNNVKLIADTVLNYPNQNYSIAYSNSILFKIDTTKTIDSLDDDKIIFNFDTISISADTMESFRQLNNEYYKFSNNVEIYRNNFSARSDLVIYKKDTIILKDNPIVWYENTQLIADSIIISLINNKLQKLEGFNNAIIITDHDSTDKERYNQISGNKIIINFDTNSKIINILSVGNSKSIYYLADEKGNNGLDRKSTDSINIEFNNNEIEVIYWLGTTVGEFIPENFIFDNPSSYNLPQFRIENNKPKKKLLKHKNLQ